MCPHGDIRECPNSDSTQYVEFKKDMYKISKHYYELICDCDCDCEMNMIVSMIVIMSIIINMIIII